MSVNVRAEDDLYLTGRGPFQVRNQFPLNLQFLSFHADDAFTLNKNDFRVSINYSHSNTFAQSSDVLNQLSNSNNRSDLSSDLTRQIERTDGNSNRFLIDTGIGRTTINLKYGVSNRLMLELDIPVMTYQGGFLDTPIEMIHKIAGFPYASRSMLIKNNSQVLFSGEKGDMFYNADDFWGPGIADIVLMAKAQLYRSHIQGFALASRIAIKLPTGNYKYLRGSGSFDYGIDLGATKKLGNSFISSNLSGVFPGIWKLMPEVQINPSYSWILSYEYIWGDNLSLILQNQVQSSFLGKEVHPEISKTIFEWTAGFKYNIGNGYRFSLSITENYIHHNNTADFGFNIGLSRGF